MADRLVLMIRYVTCLIIRAVLIGPLIAIGFIGEAADHLASYLDEHLPWVRKETEEEKRWRML